MRKKKERYLEVLTEEPSMEAFLRTLLTSLLPEGPTFFNPWLLQGRVGEGGSGARYRRLHRSIP